jgi:hypothetical protein
LLGHIDYIHDDERRLIVSCHTGYFMNL